VALEPADKSSVSYLARILFTRKFLDSEAVAVLTRGIEAVLKDIRRDSKVCLVELYRIRGEIHMMTGNLHLARRDYQKILEIGKDEGDGELEKSQLILKNALYYEGNISQKAMDFIIGINQPQHTHKDVRLKYFAESWCPMTTELERDYCIDAILYLRANLEFTYELQDWRKNTVDFKAQRQLALWKTEMQPAVNYPLVLDALVSSVLNNGSISSVTEALEKLIDLSKRENADFMELVEYAFKK